MKKKTSLLCTDMKNPDYYSLASICWANHLLVSSKIDCSRKGHYSSMDLVCRAYLSGRVNLGSRTVRNVCYSLDLAIYNIGNCNT